MNINNPPKMIGILLAMVLLTCVFLFDKLSESGYLGLMGLIIGYLVGNGIAARNDDAVEPALGASRNRRSTD